MKHISKKEIKKINIKRMKAMGIITLVIELFIVLFFDIHKIKANEFRQVDKIYTILHLSIFTWAAITVYFASRFSRNSNNKIYDYLPILSNFVVMIFISIIAVLDQMTIGNITAYISILLSKSLISILS